MVLSGVVASVTTVNIILRDVNVRSAGRFSIRILTGTSETQKYVSVSVEPLALCQEIVRRKIKIEQYFKLGLPFNYD